MAQVVAGLDRLLRILEEKVIELKAAGMDDEAKPIEEKLDKYRAMRNNAHRVLYNV